VDRGIRQTGRKNLTLAIGLAVFPWLGIASRFATSDPWKIVAVGMLLWIRGISIFWYFSRAQQGTHYENLNTSILVWTLQFVAVYAATSLAANAFLHR